MFKNLNEAFKNTSNFLNDLTKRGSTSTSMYQGVKEYFFFKYLTMRYKCPQMFKHSWWICVIITVIFLSLVTFVKHIYKFKAQLFSVQ